MRPMNLNISIVALLAFVLAACGGQGNEAAAPTSKPAEVTDVAEQTSETGGEVVNVYSGRHYDNDVVLFDEFTAETGIQVNLIEAGGNALIERIVQEGAKSPADIFITADAGNMWRAEQRGIFQAMDAPDIANRAPAKYQHPEGFWTGVTKRARVIIYNREMGLPETLATYQDLANPAHEGMVCIRPSSNIYNQSLLASIIAHDGEEVAKDWAAGVVANFARKPQGNDTAQIEAVAAGICQVGVVNSYYVARFLNADDAEKAAIGEKFGVLFPNQETTGTHVNISGAGIVANAPNPDNAKALIAYLLRDDVQARFALGNNEYPVVAGIAAQGPVATLGDFRADDLSVTAYGENQAAAIKVFDAVNWP